MRLLLVTALVFVGACGDAITPRAPSEVAAAPAVSASSIASSPSPAASPAPSTSSSAAGEFVCTPECLGGTRIPGTDENRAVLAFCEVYRRAVEARDVDTLLALASTSYLEDGGTADPSDDYGRAGLESTLRAQLSAIDSVRYEFRYRSVHREADEIRVEYTYVASFRMTKSGEWKRLVQDNELRLEPSGDSFAILSGM